MKKSILIFLLMFAIFQSAALVDSAAAEKNVKAILPTFRVQINGTTVNSKSTQYPLLVYKDITYMPMTYDYCNLLGLESSWTAEAGLKVSRRTDNTIPTITEPSAQSNNPQSVTAAIISTPVTINNNAIDNTKEPYPFLRYKDITYFPLTFKFTKEAFNIYSNFLPDTGLMVYSENKFFYQYYPEGSKQQYTDLRLSTILYDMVAINISDGTGKYPANNVKSYRPYEPGKVLSPKYEGVVYYGYLPDGKGGVKVNTDSRLNIGRLFTTKTNSLENPNSTEVEVTISEFYGE